MEEQKVFQSVDELWDKRQNQETFWYEIWYLPNSLVHKTFRSAARNLNTILGLRALQATPACYSEDSPEQGQPAARMQWTNTGFIEQGPELWRKEKGEEKQ